MKRLWIFNPETEFALASGSPFYTPPRSVLAIRKRMALFPATFADSTDSILLIDSDIAEQQELAPEYYAAAVEKGIGIVECGSGISWEEYYASPWGWNHMIRKWLTDNCPDLKGILSEEKVDVIRRLAHRRTSISFIDSLPEGIRGHIMTPIEICNPEEAISYYYSHRNLFIKAPWSSSGRGVMRTDDLLPMHVEPWIKGTIRSQGSVIIEPIYDKILDFATEWYVKDGNVSYLGISVFETSNRGKYHRNFIGTQKELSAEVISKSSSFDAPLIEAQAAAIKKLVAPEYDGPLGIDMMILSDGSIHPCVEINLRHTMGSVLIDKSQNSFNSW